MSTLYHPVEGHHHHGSDTDEGMATESPTPSMTPKPVEQINKNINDDKQQSQQPQRPQQRQLLPNAPFTATIASIFSFNALVVLSFIALALFFTYRNDDSSSLLWRYSAPTTSSTTTPGGDVDSRTHIVPNDGNAQTSNNNAKPPATNNNNNNGANNNANNNNVSPHTTTPTTGNNNNNNGNDEDYSSPPPENNDPIHPPGCPVFCPQNYDPICGSDGRTYGNLCTLHAENKCNWDIVKGLIPPVAVKSHGECPRAVRSRWGGDDGLETM